MTENTYSWELLNTTSLMIPSEIVVFHLYKYEYLIKNNRLKEAMKELEIVKSYISKEKEKERK